MNPEEGRAAPALPLALYDRALSLLHQSPDGLPPRRGHSLAERREPGDPQLPWDEARKAIRAALDPLPDDSATLHRRFARLGVRDRHRHLVHSTVAGLALPAGQWTAARSLGRALTRTGTTVSAVASGIALLVRLGEPEDIPYLFTLGLLREFTGPAVEALERLDRQAAGVVSLAARPHDELRPLVRALCARDQRAVQEELTAFPVSSGRVGAADARRVVEAVRLPRLLDRHPSDTALLARASRLLVWMGRSHDDPTDLLAYRDAPELYERVVTRAGLLPPSLDNHAALLSLALDLSSGTGVLLDWPPGRRTALLESLGRLLAEPRWASTADIAGGDADDGVRARWIRCTGRRPFALPATAGRLHVEMVAGDPAHSKQVEARILIDGRPIVPAVFTHGPVNGPDLLLEDGHLRAGPEPREVQLAEARCTEGCCGALYVTIRRDGDQVVWENWRRSMSGSRETPPEVLPHRFDAAAYDAEIARAETDRSWSWRARAVARLIKAGLIETPDLLSRWDASRGWISSGLEDPDVTVVTFWYVPGLASGTPDGADSPLQFRWDIPDDGTPPETQAAAALRRLADEDPRTYGRVCGGTRKRAQELGFPWPPQAVGGRRRQPPEPRPR
ncbi:hypothetical protein [Streptomyces sp. MI02-7b]|uniref:hypothetical protein n=1 Tax=Streptomyces sp. MI02-7b TaxID=462941 RepID=UPI0029B6039F|nr:hypothetical protein [Streptomyces sp. MI02-7b]MDX3071018.1 hypothetical protein [Streptomyces sp. MI02-7b]